MLSTFAKIVFCLFFFAHQQAAIRCPEGRNAETGISFASKYSTDYFWIK